MTGGSVAVPIFDPIIQAAWAYAARKQVLAPPSAEASRQLSCTSIGLEPQEGRRRSRSAATECFRLDRGGRIIDSRYRLVSHENDTQERDDMAMRRGYGRAYGFENQPSWPWNGPWQGAPQWRWRSDNEWHGRQHVRAFQAPRHFNFRYYRRR